MFKLVTIEVTQAGGLLQILQGFSTFAASPEIRYMTGGQITQIAQITQMTQDIFLDAHLLHLPRSVRPSVGPSVGNNFRFPF